VYGWQACQHNSADVAFLLIECKADISKQNRKGGPFVAVERGVVVKALLFLSRFLRVWMCVTWVYVHVPARHVGTIEYRRVSVRMCAHGMALQGHSVTPNAVVCAVAIQPVLCRFF
jgi:hypothetical protein